MEKPPEWPPMADEIEPSRSPVAVPREDPLPRDDGFVGTAQVPPRAAATVRVPRPPVGVAAAPRQTEALLVAGEPTAVSDQPVPILAPSSPAVPWTASGPPARAVSGGPARGSGVAARLPFPGAGADRQAPAAPPSATPAPAAAWPVKGLVVFVAIVVAVLGLGLTGYLWALPVYDQTHRSLAVPSEVVGLPKVTDPTVYAAMDGMTTAAREVGMDRPVVVIYQATDDPVHRVMFLGGQHVVWAGVGGFLGRAFQELRPGLALAQDGAVDAGPLGGVARCAAGRARTVPLALCGWQDHGTIGLLVFSNRTPAEGAVLLRAVRPALEHPTG